MWTCIDDGFDPEQTAQFSVCARLKNQNETGRHPFSNVGPFFFFFSATTEQMLDLHFNRMLMSLSGCQKTWRVHRPVRINFSRSQRFVSFLSAERMSALRPNPTDLTHRGTFPKSRCFISHVHRGRSLLKLFGRSRAVRLDKTSSCHI